MVKIFVDYETTENPWGGINSFIRAFKEELARSSENIMITPKINDADIYFMAASSTGINRYNSVSKVKSIKRRNNFWNRLFLRRKPILIVHRLDGLRATYKGEFQPSDKLQIDLSKFADFIIFQSKCSLEAFRLFGYNDDNYKIIYNGCSQQCFYPARQIKERVKPYRVLAVSWSDGLNKGFSDISELSKYDDFKVTFVGRWNNDVPINKVEVLPPLKREELAEIYRKHDVFIHAANNDPCPNVVIEALSSGLPVIYRDNGGTKELAQEFGIKLPGKIEESTVKKLVEDLDGHMHELKLKIIKNQSRFNIEQIAKQYIIVITEKYYEKFN